MMPNPNASGENDNGSEQDDAIGNLEVAKGITSYVKVCNMATGLSEKPNASFVIKSKPKKK